MYSKTSEHGRVIIIFWVDDIIVAASNDQLLNLVKTYLSSKFEMKDLGKLRWFLGIEFSKHDGCITMSQKKYCEKILSKFGMENCKPRKSPCHEGLDKEPDDSQVLDDPRLYREIVGSLIYAMTATRPDISYVVTKLSQNMSKPTTQNLIVAKGVLRYLRGTLEYTLVFRKSIDPVQLEGFCDSDRASSYSDRKSISAYVFKLSEHSALISWKTKKQNIVALSSCEAKYISLSMCVQEAMFLRKLISLVYDVEMCVKIGVDNQGTIALAKNPINQQRSKHIDVRYHFLRASGIVFLRYVPSNENVADVLTKPVSGCQNCCATKILLLPPGKLRFSEGIVFSCVCCCFCFFVSVTPQFFTRNIQDSSTKLSGIICRPPEQIKFDYHDSNSLPVALRMG